MTNCVQSAVTSVSFPKTFEKLREMGRNWLEVIGSDWITDIDVLQDFPQGKNVSWIAPKWLTAGDLLFFYHTKSGNGIIKRLRKESSLVSGVSGEDGDLTPQEIKSLMPILERVNNLSDYWYGKIFAVGLVSGRPERAFYKNKHFKGTIYAPIDSVHVFDRPISSDEFRRFLKIGQNTITPIYGDQFSQLKALLNKRNELPVVLSNAVPGDLSFRDVNKDNWPQISCRSDARFINEAQLRAYLLDYLLREIKDLKSPLHAECNCYRNGERTGIADYFIRFMDKWIPVEAKLNVLAEHDLTTQILKYVHTDSFSPTIGASIRKDIQVYDNAICLVFDQAGLYVTRDGVFLECSSSKPIVRREDIRHETIQDIKTLLTRFI